MSYFPPPRRIETTVFTRLPDRFRRPRRTAWCDANRGGREVDSFLEGPAFDRQGRLYVTDIPFGRVFRISSGRANGNRSPNMTAGRTGSQSIATAASSSPTIGAGWCCSTRRPVAVNPFLETALSEGFKGVNDLVFSTDGDIYFTDQGQTGLQDPSGRVYRYSAGGILGRLIDTVPSPNGIALERRWQGAVRGRHPCQPDLAPAAPSERRDDQGQHLRPPSWRAQWPRRPGAGRGGLPAGRPCQFRLGLAAVALCAEPLDRIVSCAGSLDHQSCLRRPWRKKPVHHRGRNRKHPSCRATGARSVCSTPTTIKAATGVLASILLLSPQSPHGAGYIIMVVKKRSRPAVKGVATADRVLAVLTAFKKGDGTLSLAELSSRTGLVKSTIMRLAVSLEKHGLMARVADSSYRLDAEVFRLGMLYRQSFRLGEFCPARARGVGGPAR